MVVFLEHFIAWRNFFKLYFFTIIPIIKLEGVVIHAILFFCFFFIEVLSAGPRMGKIYDCFTFFNELDTLKIRLRELYDKVDYFVIVEAEETFSGVFPKPLYFKDHQDEFSPYLDKIIHVVVEGRYQLNNPNPWPREAYQRNQIMRGLKNCNENDVIVVSDVDEIIRADDLENIISQLLESTIPIVGCNFVMYRLCYNLQDPNVWTGPAVTTFGHLQFASPQHIRDHRGTYFMYPNGGWHFSSMGGFRAIQEKFRGFSHYQEIAPENLTMELYPTLINTHNLRSVLVDSTYPKFIKENLEYFKQKGLLID